jgi:hypothetical protein
VGMELESKKVEMVKLKSQKEELRLNLAKWNWFWIICSQLLLL